MSRHDSRAWHLMEALDAAPFGNEERLEIIQGVLDEERAEAAHDSREDLDLANHGLHFCPTCSGGNQEHIQPESFRELAARGYVRINRRSATEGF